ncbi:MAG: RsmB/NOP family class I SAM-dependent RNA methyltransferase [Candidatus Nanoarchaeia archaeon]|nr:RsmB/NOP family class I SAM-dependent RNA methyltransferase [Candidatus Nanoarchaeia archaeon]MDD5054274.1 RsmB/NOP family class I SAM-dependent RNA methyltransferase [Candidatus Nanoarchaeia archaeon]
MSSKKPIFKDSFKDYFSGLLGDELNDFIESCKKPLPESIRVNKLKILPLDLKKNLESKGWVLENVPFYDSAFIVKKRPISLGNALEHFLGQFYVQEQSSMIPPLVLNPGLNDVVLDACASPGSKTTQLSEMMKNAGVIVANDLGIGRISILSANIDRMGCRNVVVSNGDGKRFGNHPNFFDKILLDAPCTGYGAIRKDWSIAKMFNPKSYKFLANIQKSLLKTCWKSLNPGGELVYSTCTLTKEENEDNVVDFLNSTPDAKIEKINLKGFEKHRGINLNEAIRIWPHRIDMEGFFIAKLVKKK